MSTLAGAALFIVSYLSIDYDDYLCERVLGSHKIRYLGDVEGEGSIDIFRGIGGANLLVEILIQDPILPSSTLTISGAGKCSDGFVEAVLSSNQIKLNYYRIVGGFFIGEFKDNILARDFGIWEFDVAMNGGKDLAKLSVIWETVAD